MQLTSCALWVLEGGGGGVGREEAGADSERGQKDLATQWGTHA